MAGSYNARCLSSCSYIKPQLFMAAYAPPWGCLSSCSYIKPQPYGDTLYPYFGCLSSCSYIKPQRFLSSYANLKSCLSSCSYIKPQLINPMQIYYIVVYHLVPTSNHNVEEVIIAGKKVIYHLVPTSNHNSLQPLDVTAVLFIILFLHQTTTYGAAEAQRSGLFIILFLHQTTT